MNVACSQRELATQLTTISGALQQMLIESLPDSVQSSALLDALCGVSKAQSALNEITGD